MTAGRVPAEASWLPDHPGEEEVAPGLKARDVVAFLRRPATPAGWLFEPDVEFSSAPSLALHLYRPAVAGPPRPGALFVHGGAWDGGHPYAHIRRACLLAGRGWVTATAELRRASEGPWPAQRADVQAAAGWLLDHAGDIGLDRDRLAGVGDSSGGHLVASAAVDGTPFAALVLLYPVLDLGAAPGLETAIDRLVGRSLRRRREASPVGRVTPRTPPTLTIAGDADELVPLSGVLAWHRALDRAGVPNRLHIAPGMGHAFDWHPEGWQLTFDEMVRFLDARLGPPTMPGA